jgi:hypothetical protein
MHGISLGPGGRTVGFTHPREAVYNVIAGSARVAEPDGAGHDVAEGAMVHVEERTPYSFSAGREPGVGRRTLPA